MDAVRHARALRLSGQYDRLGDHLLPEQRGPVIELIHSVDRLVWANDVLQTAVKEHLGTAVATAFDRAGVADVIGVFSRDVRLLEERIAGDTATITIQVAGRLPLESVHLRWRDARWLIVTDEPIPQLPRELRRLADVLLDTAERLEAEKLSAEDLAARLQAMEAPVLRRIRRLTQPR